MASRCLRGSGGKPSLQVPGSLDRSTQAPNAFWRKIFRVKGLEEVDVGTYESSILHGFRWILGLHLVWNLREARNLQQLSDDSLATSGACWDFAGRRLAPP